MSELTDDRLLRYVAMLRHECAYKGPCKDNGDGCTCSAVELDARHMRTLRAAASTSTKGAGVKGLEWRREPANLRYEGWQADTAFGTTYQCSHVSGKWQTWRYEDETPLGVFNTADEAKAAAQADYEARILSCLNPPAPKVTTDEAEERG